MTGVGGCKEEFLDEWEPRSCPVTSCELFGQGQCLSPTYFNLNADLSY